MLYTTLNLFWRKGSISRGFYNEGLEKRLSLMYEEIGRSVGKTDHMDKLKAASWRQFRVYMECYDGAGDAILLARRVDHDTLYPLSVVTMMNIFDAGTCYGEYCEHEFYASGGWESVSLDDNADSPVFYIKPYEF